MVPADGPALRPGPPLNHGVRLPISMHFYEVAMSYHRRVLGTICSLLCLSLSACATAPSQSASVVRDADERTVANCQFLANVSGTSGWGNLAASAGINNAKNEGREQAAQLGATHIVWNVVQGGYSPYVSGNAYKCQ